MSNVEGGGISVVAASVSRPVASFGPIVNEGPLRSLNFSDFEPINSLPTLVNEGPPSKSLLADMPYIGLDNLNPRGGNRFDFETPLNAKDAILEAESILAQARTSPLTAEPSVLVGPALAKNPRTQLEPIVQMYRIGETATQVVIQPEVKRQQLTTAFLDPAPKTESVPAVQVTTHQAESKSSSQTIQTSPQAQEQEIEEIVAEKKLITGEPQVEEIEVVDEERHGLSLKDVEDVEVTKQRIDEFKQAIDKAGAEKEDDQGIDGRRVVELLPTENPNNQSQIVRGKGPDGSRVETIEEFAVKKFTSREKAIKAARILISEKPPVKKAKEGKHVPFEAVFRVLKYYLVKSAVILQTAAYEVVVTRIIKKKIQISSGQNSASVIVEEAEVKSERAEGSLEDLSPELSRMFNSNFTSV